MTVKMQTVDVSERSFEESKTQIYSMQLSRLYLICISFEDNSAPYCDSAVFSGPDIFVLTLLNWLNAD